MQLLKCLSFFLFYVHFQTSKNSQLRSILDDLIRVMTLRFIFVVLVLQTIYLAHGKNNNVRNLLSCDITPIYFSVRAFALLPYRKWVALKNV